jgi:RNA polymerase sigma-70 factor (ECF subfamily)
MRAAFEANATDLLAYLERRIEPRSAAADVLGDAMLVAWRRVDDLPRDPVRARMWLFVVARNSLSNHRRSIGRHRAAVERLRGFIAADVEGSRTELDQVDLRASVATAMAALPPAEAEIVRLVNWEGFSLAEIAVLEGLPASTVRSRYSTALRRLETSFVAATPSSRPE